MKNSLFKAFAKGEGAWGSPRLPVLMIIIVALVPRLLAAIFAKGYGMHDDAFGPVQSMQELLQDWSLIYEDIPKLLLYPIAQYFTFGICELFGIFDPQAKMYVVRFLHALYSLLTVVLGYKIALEITSPQVARKAGIVVALLWMLPYMSVRNLVELAVAPPVMAGVLYVLRSHREPRALHCATASCSGFKWWTPLIIAGIFFGLSFAMRFQSAFVPIGIGMALLLQKRFRETIVLTVVSVIVASLLLIVPEYLIWGKPFGSLIHYFALQTGDYPHGPWYNTVGLIIGVLIPPMSLLLLFGYFRPVLTSIKERKKLSNPDNITNKQTNNNQLLLLSASFIFLLFHIIYPFKQERFILTVVPLLAVACIIGWEEFVAHSSWWQRHKRLLGGFWVWFWSVNTVLLVLFTFSYSKRTRVESFTYLSDKPVQGIAIELDETGTYFPPTFYLGKNSHKPIYLLYKGYDTVALSDTFRLKQSGGVRPNYAIFFDERNLAERMKSFESNFNCRLYLEKEIEAGLLDKILHFTNPRHNKNYTAFVYYVDYNKN